MYTESFGKKLAKARKEAGYTQVQIEKELGFAQCTLSNWETGRTQPDFESVAILANFYCVSTDWLFGLAPQNNNKRTIA